MTSKDYSLETSSQKSTFEENNLLVSVSGISKEISPYKNLSRLNSNVGDYSGLYPTFAGGRFCVRNPWYLARQQRNIENNQTPIYEDFMTTLSTSPFLKTSSTSNSPMSSSPLSQSDIPSIPILTKEEYMQIVKSRRQLFVHKNFGNTLTDVFASLKDDANKSNACHREIVFEVPEHFDIEKTEKILCEYFTDCGYKPFPESRKEFSSRIVITLT